MKKRLFSINGADTTGRTHAKKEKKNLDTNLTSVLQNDSN